MSLKRDDVGTLPNPGSIGRITEGHVAYARNGEGMGIRFSSIEPNSVSILDGWLTELDNWVLSS